jgi:RNA polymerase sigma-70 factor (ECF subfamily)
MADSSPTSEDEARFNRLVDEYGGLLRSTIIRLCPKDLGIDFNDVEQEARLRLWRGVQSEREILNPASYIYRVAVTTTIDAIRRVKARREEQLRSAEEGGEEADSRSEPVSPDARPDRVAAARELFRNVEEALALMSEDRRRAVGLHLQGMTTTEIADLMQWTEARARNLVYRGLADLRERLRARGIEYEIE